MSKRCPTRYKQGFRDRSAAIKAIERQSGVYGRIAVTAYRCECGFWHVVGPRRAVSEENRKRNHRRKGGMNKKRLYQERRRKRRSKQLSKKITVSSFGR